MPELRARLEEALGTAYRVGDELGGGGMSRVFRATDAKLGRAVVVKVLPPDLGAGVNIVRFQREIAVAAKLQHPHIVPLLNAGSHDDLLYYIMPYIDGESLRARLVAERQLPIPDAVRILREVADALAYAHANGVVHRDIKPGNVLLSGKHAFVTDFGVAKAVEESTGKATLLTMGMALGTPAYMPPEQATADPSTDHRADIYAFGALSYEILTGRPPFTASSPHALVTAHLTERPDPLTKHRAEISPALAAVVMRCLAKQPGDRWQTANDVLERLEQMSTPSTSPVAAAGFGRRSGRRRVVVLALGIVVLVAAAFLGLRGLGAGRVGTLLASGMLEERDRLVLADFENRTRDSTLGPSVSEAFRIDLAQSGAVRLLDGAAIAGALERMNRRAGTRLELALARDVAQREGAKAVVRGQIDPVGPGYVIAAELVSATDGSVLVAVRESAKDDGALIEAVDRLSKRLRERIGESLRSIRASEPLERVTTGSLEALRRYTQALHAELGGDFDRAASLVEEALALDTGFAMAYRKLAMVMYNTANSQSRMDAAATNAFVRRDRLPPVERYLTTGSYYSRVEYDPAKAEEAYRAVLELDPDNFIAGNNLTELYADTRRFAAAESLGLRHLRTARFPIYINVARALLGQGKLDDAAAVASAYDLNAPGAPTAVLLRSYVDENRDELDSAEARLRAADQPQRDLAWQAWSSSHLVALLQLRGRLHEAARMARRFMDVSERRGLPGAYLTGAIQLANMKLRFEEAPTVARRTVETALARHPLATIPVEDRPYALLIVFHAESGDSARARALLAEYERAPQRLRRRDPYWHAAIAAIAVAEGRSADAARSYRRWYEESGCARCGLFELARLHDAAGEVDSVRAITERALSSFGLYRVYEDAWSVAGAYKRLGELYEQRGDTARARDSYSRFVSLWKDADPPLQPAVRDVRARLARLSRDAR